MNHTTVVSLKKPWNSNLVNLVMGWQSYAIPFDTQEQLETIINIIKKHNSNCYFPEFVRTSPSVEFKQLESGEELAGSW